MKLMKPRLLQFITRVNIDEKQTLVAGSGGQSLSVSHLCVGDGGGMSMGHQHSGWNAQR